MTRVGELVRAIFDGWNREGIAFLVLRNYEGLPDEIGNDLDVLVAERRRAELVLLDRAREHGWRLHNRAEFSPLSLFLSDRDRATQIHVDLFDRLVWRGMEILPAADLLHRRVPRGAFSIPSATQEAALNLVTRLLYHGYVKEKYAPAVARAFGKDPEAASRVLADPFGSRRAARLVRDATQGEWERIEASAQALRRALVARRLLRSPLPTARNLVSDALRLARRWLRPPGLVVALLGPDGSGKSTVAPLVLDLLDPSFSREGSRLLHWKPRVFPVRRSDTADATQPHGRAPRGRIASCAFFVFHLAEYVVGAFVRVRPLVFRNFLVVFDRHYDDFLVDCRRYRLDVPPWLLRAGRRLVPRPDLVFVLDASPELLRARKQEVSEEECTRQRNAYRALVHELPNGHLVDASRPPQTSAEEMCGIALDHLAARTAARARGRRG